MDDLKRDLEVKRHGYDDEGVWHRFLIDSYAGCGGFQGRVKQPPSGYWGMAAAQYTGFLAQVIPIKGAAGDNERHTYLDRYPREDALKFQKRIGLAHYLNYVKPIANLYVSYLMRKPFTRANVPPALEKWIEESDWDENARQRALRAVVLGWFPVLVDMPTTPEGARTAAEAGDMGPYTVEMLPMQIMDYGLDDDGDCFAWVKTCVRLKRKPAWNAETQDVERYTVWSKDDFMVFEIIDGRQVVTITEQPQKHPFGEVPIVVFRAGAAVNDAVKADSMIGDIAMESRRLFNLLSELDEHMRSQVFALLAIPARSPEQVQEVGTENALTFDPQATKEPFYLAPPASVAETYEKRIAATIIEIYRMARVEYDRASGTESSAQSKQQNFEQTNLAIADLARSLAAAEEELLELVGKGLGISDAELEKIEVVAADSYETDALNDEVDRLVTLLTVSQFGPTFQVELLRRIADRILPNLSPETRAIVQSEIEDAVKLAEAARAAVDSTTQQDTGEDDGDPDAPPDDGSGIDSNAKAGIPSAGTARAAGIITNAP